MPDFVYSIIAYAFIFGVIGVELWTWYGAAKEKELSREQKYDRDVKRMITKPRFNTEQEVQLSKKPWE